MTMAPTIEQTAAARADRLQVLAFLTAAAAAILLWLALGSRIPLTAELLVASLSVALLGIPHGALDFMHMRRLAARLGRPGMLWAGFLAYLLLSGLVIVAWIACPGATLAIFLAATVLHWGVEDMRGQLLRRFEHGAEVLLRGGMPIVLPCALHQDETAWLFAQLVPADTAQALVQCVGASWIALVALAVLLLAGMAVRRAAGVPASWWTPLELAMVAGLFVLTPPLITFTIYFGLLHSGRFLARYAVANRRGAGGEWTGLVKDALPMTLLTWLFAIAALPFLAADRTSTQMTLQILFIGLAALTFPHAFLMMSLRILKPPEGDGVIADA